MVVVSSARSFAARSPNAPPEKKKKKRRGFLSPLLRLYRKTRLAIRIERKTSFSPPITLSFLSQSLSRFPKEKMPLAWSPEKNTSVGRERRRHQNVVVGIVALLERSVYLERVLPKERIEYSFLCLHKGENLKVFSLSSSCPPSQKKNENPKPATSLPFFFSPIIFVILDWILSKVSTDGVPFDTAPLRKEYSQRNERSVV